MLSLGLAEGNEALLYSSLLRSSWIHMLRAWSQVRRTLSDGSSLGEAVERKKHMKQKHQHPQLLLQLLLLLGFSMRCLQVRLPVCAAT